MENRIYLSGHDFQYIELIDVDMTNCIWINRPESPECNFKYECFEEGICPYNIENCNYKPKNVKLRLY